MPRPGGRRRKRRCCAVPSPRAHRSRCRVTAGRCSAGSRRRARMMRWVGDGLHGPRVGGRKTYLFAWLDDHSRLLTGYRFGFAEDTVRLALPFRKALASRGVPQAIYVDNGIRLHRRAVDAGVRETRYPVDPFHPAPPAGPREDRTVLSDRARSVPRRGHRFHRRGSRRRRARPRRGVGRAEPAVHRLGRNPSTTARVHSETGQTPLERWEQGWTRLGRSRRWRRPGT